MTDRECHTKDGTLKRRYGLKEDALRAIKRFRRDRGAKKEAYQCRQCDTWHIGHSDRGERAWQ